MSVAALVLTVSLLVAAPASAAGKKITRVYKFDTYAACMDRRADFQQQYLDVSACNFRADLGKYVLTVTTY